MTYKPIIRLKLSQFLKNFLHKNGLCKYLCMSNIQFGVNQKYVTTEQVHTVVKNISWNRKHIALQHSKMIFKLLI